MKKAKLMVLASAALMLSLSACGSDDDNTNEPGGNNGGNSAVIEDTKEYVASTAEDLIAKLDNPQSRELIELIQHLMETYGDAEFDDEYPMRNIARSGDIIDLATEDNGIYEYRNGDWEYVGPSDKVVFQMNDSRYGKITYTVTRGTATDNISGVVDGESINAIIPRTANAELRAGSKVMLTQNATSRIDQRGGSVNVEQKTVGGGLEFVTTLTGNNSSATFNETLAVVGETVMTTTGTLKGSGLCDLNAIDNASEYDRPYDVIKSATVNCDILGKIQMRGNLNFTKAFYDAADDAYEYGQYPGAEYSSAAAASAACDRAIEVVNNCYNANVYFNGSTASQAKVVFVKDGYQGSDYGYYEPMPTIQFADGSTYTDSYFEGIFDRAINKWNMLFN